MLVCCSCYVLLCSLNSQLFIVTLQGGAEIGQRIGLSDKDTQKLNKMYCDSDNNSDEEEVPAVPQKHHHKKKPSNQPFQGHGIGYHQGKALVIKLPAAETFSLTDKSIHKPMFDYFSKSPKAVLPKSVQEFGIGKKVNEHPVKSHNDNSNNLIKELNKKHDFDFSKFTKDYYQPEAIETKTHKPEQKHSPKSNNSDMMKSSGQEDEDGDLESEKFNLHDHLTELDKIIKSRVYPSQKENDHVLFYMKEYDGFKPESIETTTQKESNIYSNINESDKSDSKESFTHEEDEDDFESSPFDGHVPYTSVDFDDKIPQYKNEYSLRQPQINKTTPDTNNEDTQEFSKNESAESSADNEDHNTFASESVDDHFMDVDKVIKNKVKGDSLKKDINFRRFRNEYNRLNMLRKGSYFPMSVTDTKSEDENNEDHSFLFSSEENNDYLIPKGDKKGNTYEYYSHEDSFLPKKSDAYAENKGTNEDSNEKPRNKEKNRFGDFSDNLRKLSYYQPSSDSKISYDLSQERHDDLIDKSIEENIKLNAVKIKSMSEQQENLKTSPVKELSNAPQNHAVKEVHENIKDFDVDDTELPSVINNFTNNDNLTNDDTTSTDNPKNVEHSKKESKLEVDPKSEVIIFNEHKSVEELEIPPGESLEPIKLEDKTKIIRQANFKTLTYSSAEKIDHYAPFATVQPARYEVIKYLPYTSVNTYSPDTHDFDTYHIKNKYLSYPDFNKHSGNSAPHLFY